MGKRGEYGEPWTAYYGTVNGAEVPFLQGADAEEEFAHIIASQDEHGDTPHLTTAEVVRRMKRAAACVNALAGRDPAKLEALVEAANVIATAGQVTCDSHRALCDALAAIDGEQV